MLRLIILSFLFTTNVFAFDFFTPKARTHIHVVGSSTVYPFTSVIAETFGRDTEFRTPIIESTGTGGGFKLFCSGVGYEFPDFSNASRLVEPSEIAKCAEHGVKEIVEIKIGYDGIVLANSVAGKKFSLTKEQIFLALRDGSAYQKWSEIDPLLPNTKIIIYGPPTSSGTRDAFVELVMEEPCKKLTKLSKKKCGVIRSDGHFIEAGENDNLIVQKLKNDPDALGIFGFSFLEENHGTIKAADINHVVPSFDSIVSGRYKVSRPLFIYFKKEHLNLIPGMREFVQEIISKNTIGKDGYLLQKGLIPLTDLEIKKARDGVVSALK
ncbi:MAG: phosphate ABC transporter substrate-binding protein [Alphaproteobacteria bacterium]|nr:phosphate ABC transporter substrate-binding protein [Alphaproteobacteria bacterium]